MAEKYPEMPGAERAGFWAAIDPMLFAVGEHRVDVTVEGCGRQRQLASAAFVTAPPTPAWIAWPLLVLILIAVPLAVGRVLSRRQMAESSIPALEMRIAALLAALLVTIVAARHVGQSLIDVDAGLFAPLANWDGRFYLALAAQGYSPDSAAAYAYFPLYPALLRLVSILPLPLALAGSLINCGLVLLLVVLLRRLYPRQDRAVLFYAATPFAFFFVATYTEALALALAAGFLLALRRGRLGWAFALGALAGLTRITALPLALFALDDLRRRRWRPACVALAAPVSGLGLWMLWLWRTTGDPLRFLHVQTEFGRTTTFHAGRLLDQLAAAARGASAQTWWELSFLFLVLASAAALAFRGRWGEGAYSAAIVLLPLATLRLTSLNRYALAAFPVYLLLGGLLRRRLAFRLVLALELALLFFHAARFGRQYWVG